MATLDQTEAGSLRPRGQIVLIDQGAQYDPGQISEADGNDVLQEPPLAQNLELTRLDGVDELDRAVAAGRTREPEAQLVDGQPEVLDFVIAEPESAGQTSRGDARQTQELRASRDNQAHFICSSHDRRTVAPVGPGPAKSGPMALLSGAIEGCSRTISV